jgi:hypothetical protein
MRTQFKGTTTIDIRDSVIANAGVRYTQWHTTALCSPTRSEQPDLDLEREREAAAMLARE